MGISIFQIMKITSKDQATIPKELREKYGMRDKASVTETEEGILFASIITGHPGEVIIPLNFFRVPLMFVSGLFIPLDSMPQAGLILAFLSPLTHTLDLIKIGIGKASFFGWNANIGVLCTWIIVFLFVGQMFHKIIMKKE